MQDRTSCLTRLIKIIDYHSAVTFHRSNVFVNKSLLQNTYILQ